MHVPFLIRFIGMEFWGIDVWFCKLKCLSDNLWNRCLKMNNFILLGCSPWIRTQNIRSSANVSGLRVSNIGNWTYIPWNAKMKVTHYVTLQILPPTCHSENERYIKHTYKMENISRVLSIALFFFEKLLEEDVKSGRTIAIYCYCSYYHVLIIAIFALLCLFFLL
jgi:hypothetical protein